MVCSHAKKRSSVKFPPRLLRHTLWRSTKQHLFYTHSWQTQHAISGAKYPRRCSISTCLFTENTSWPQKGHFWLLPHVPEGTCPPLCTPDEVRSTTGAATAVPGGTCPPLCTSDEVRSTTRTTAGVAAIRAWVRGPIWLSPDTSKDICPSICAPIICLCVGRPTWGPWSSVKLIRIGWLGSPWFTTAALQFSWASSSGITGLNGWSLCCSIWAADDTVSYPILKILSTSRVRTTRVTTLCLVFTLRVDPLLP